MKYLLTLLFCLLMFGAQAQKTIEWYRITRDSLPLNYNPSQSGNIIKTNYYNIDPKTGEQKRRTTGSNWVSDSLFKGVKGDIGPQGPIGPQGIQGVAGPQGPAGNGNITFPNEISFPSQYGACNCQDLIPNQQWIDSLKLNMVGATTSWTKDRAALQMTLRDATFIIWSGNYYVNGSLKRNKYSDTKIDGNSVIYSTFTTGALFTSDEATSLADANVMEGYSVTLSNITLSLQSGQTGFDINPCFMFSAFKCNSYGGTTGFLLEFCLVPYMTLCRAQNCANGLILTYSGVAGGGINTSESNAGTINSFRTHTVSNVGIFIDDVYETTINNYVCEGNGSIVNAVKIISSGTTDKSTTINGFHFEQTGGCSDALFKINTRDMDVIIKNPIAHYGGILIDATSTTGLGMVTLERCSYAVGVGGKYFKMNNITAHFERNNYFPSESVVNNCFVSGFALSKCTGVGCGYGKYTIDIIGR